MSERHCGLEFDQTSQHSFEKTCTTGNPLNESVFAAYGIQRNKTDEGVETSYANGITVIRHKEGDFGVIFPDNLKHRENKDGLSIITDKKGHSVAYLSAEGNLLMPAANGQVLQENKNGEVSVNDMTCFGKSKSAKHEPQVIEMEPLVITVKLSDLERKNDHYKKTDDTKKKGPQKPAPKPFNWDSDDPLEGIDVSGY